MKTIPYRIYVELNEAERMKIMLDGFSKTYTSAIIKFSDNGMTANMRMETELTEEELTLLSLSFSSDAFCVFKAKDKE